MAQTVVQTWEEEMQERANRQSWEAALLARREDLRTLLESRFGPLPEGVTRRIEQTNDAELLRAALVHTLRMKSLDELQL